MPGHKLLIYKISTDGKSAKQTKKADKVSRNCLDQQAGNDHKWQDRGKDGLIP